MDHLISIAQRFGIISTSLKSVEQLKHCIEEKWSEAFEKSLPQELFVAPKQIPQTPDKDQKTFGLFLTLIGCFLFLVGLFIGVDTSASPPPLNTGDMKSVADFSEHLGKSTILPFFMYGLGPLLAGWGVLEMGPQYIDTPPQKEIVIKQLSVLLFKEQWENLTTHEQDMYKNHHAFQDPTTQGLMRMQSSRPTPTIIIQPEMESLEEILRGNPSQSIKM